MSNTPKHNRVARSAERIKQLSTAEMGGGHCFRFNWLNSMARMMAATMATTRAVIISENSETGMRAAVRMSMASKMIRN